MAQNSDIKIGDPVCPLCGGKVIHTKFNADARSLLGKTPQFDFQWICTECGSEFSAETKGGVVTFKEVSVEQDHGYGIDILGNTAGRIL